MNYNAWDLIKFTKNNIGFSFEDYKIVKKIKNLAKKHQRIAKMDCNGVGTINGITYHSGISYGEKPDVYGAIVKSAYLKDETTVFDRELDKLEGKIEVLILGRLFLAEYEGDPRGQTVKLYYNGNLIDFNLF